MDLAQLIDMVYPDLIILPDLNIFLPREQYLLHLSHIVCM